MCTAAPTTPSDAVWSCPVTAFGGTCGGGCALGFRGTPVATCGAGGAWTVTGTCTAGGLEGECLLDTCIVVCVTHVCNRACLCLSKHTLRPGIACRRRMTNALQGWTAHHVPWGHGKFQTLNAWGQRCVAASRMAHQCILSHNRCLFSCSHVR